MRVLVCGGRDYKRTEVIFSVLDNLHKEKVIDCLIHGDAKGADRRAGWWAERRRINMQVFPAEWNRYGKQAGFIRNRKMLEEGKPDLVIAFKGGHGTRMMVDLALKAGVPVKEYN